MNQAQMLQQVRKMQEQMQKAQEELAASRITGSAAGGLVQIEISGDFRVQSVKISKDAIDPEDAETLEDLVIVAVNDALAKVQAESSQKMGAVTGGLKIPGLM